LENYIFMKKFLLPLAAVFVFALSLTSCNTNSPKAAADKFLNSLYHMDYKEAKTVATEDTKKMLDMMESFSSMMPDSAKQNAKKIKIDIKDVKEDGDKATVIYTTSENNGDQKIDLVKQNGKWLVQYSKQDGGGEEMGDQPMEEPAMTDTSAVPVEEMNTTPSTADTAMAH
jgi:GH25 family lysozyme M1 (1,4-beta-N-acetylmuramidase)